MGDKRYFCNRCKKHHNLSSKIGNLHKTYSNKPKKSKNIHKYNLTSLQAYQLKNQLINKGYRVSIMELRRGHEDITFEVYAYPLKLNEIQKKIKILKEKIKRQEQKHKDYKKSMYRSSSEVRMIADKIKRQKKLLINLQKLL